MTTLALAAAAERSCFQAFGMYPPLPVGEALGATLVKEADRRSPDTRVKRSKVTQETVAGWILDAFPTCSIQPGRCWGICKYIAEAQKGGTHIPDFSQHYIFDFIESLDVLRDATPKMIRVREALLAIDASRSRPTPQEELDALQLFSQLIEILNKLSAYEELKQKRPRKRNPRGFWHLDAKALVWLFTDLLNANCGIAASQTHENSKLFEIVAHALEAIYPPHEFSSGEVFRAIRNAKS